MSTGVTASDEVVTNFTELKKQSNKTTYVVYKIEDGKIVTEFTSGEDALFSDFLTHLPADDCRYALYKMDFTTNDGRPGNKLVNIAWAPDTAKVKSKMLYAGSKEAFTRVLVGVATKITATDSSELTEDIVKDACKKFA